MHRPMKHLRRAVISAVVGLSLVSLTAFAQDEKVMTGTESAVAPASTNTPAAQAPEQERLPITVSAGLAYQADSDIEKGGAGSMEITRVNAGIAMPFKLNDTMKLATSFKYEFANYDFSGGLDPWQDINTLSA